MKPPHVSPSSNPGESDVALARLVMQRTNRDRACVMEDRHAGLVPAAVDSLSP
jgi:hypothetical protein